MARNKRTSARDTARTNDREPESATPAEREADSFIGPSPDPGTNLLLADLALQGGSLLVRKGLEKGFLGEKYAPAKAAQILKRRTLGQALVGSALVKLATRSVPGAIVVGGGLLAKTLYDRRKQKIAASDNTNPASQPADPARETGDENQQG